MPNARAPIAECRQSANHIGVDVIVPCYNYGRFLRDCVDSVLAQQGCSVRILIIDDASTDGSMAVAQALAERDSRIQLRAHDLNRGHIATYNEGIAWSSAPYMLLLSADDMVAPGAFARAVALMEAHRNVGFVYGPSLRFTDMDGLGKPAARQNLGDEGASPDVEAGVDFIRRVCANPVNRVETAAVVVRTCLQKQAGGYRPELPHSGDMEMWLRLAARADVGLLPTVQAFTRIHARNMHLEYKADRDLEDFLQRRIVFQTFFATDGRDLPERAALETMARGSLAEELLWAAARAFDEAAPSGLVRKLADEARDLFPPITRTALWWKVGLRGLIGSRSWSRLSAVRNLMHGEANTT